MRRPVTILGIETSCDETGAAVVRAGREMLSSVVASSLEEHRPYGGIIPEIASRRQMETIVPVVRQALSEAGIGLPGIDAVAVTARPGLIGSLLVGLSFARALARESGLPLVEVDHIEAHAYAGFLRRPGEKEGLGDGPPLPAVGLVVSGGHTSLFLLPRLGAFELVGRTRDDAAGEAFDKVARILDLGYPGGPAIDRLAAEVEDRATPVFPCAELTGTLDFSFSGIKTSVLYHVRDSGKGDAGPIAAAFQKSVVGVLCRKAFEACARYGARSLVLGGGVACNSALRRCLEEEGGRRGVTVTIPPREWCLDNAAMVAGLAVHRLPFREARS